MSKNFSIAGCLAMICLLQVVAHTYGFTPVEGRIVDFDMPGFPDTSGIGGTERRVMDSMAVPHANRTERSQWDTWYNYMPENRVTYNCDGFSMKWFFGITDADTAYFPAGWKYNRDPGWYGFNQTQFYMGYASINAFANPQFRTTDNMNHMGMDGVWTPLETTKYGLSATRPCHMFGLMVWRHKEFLNIAAGQSARFDNTSVLYAHYDRVPRVTEDEVQRFAICNGSQWYMSEISFKNRYDRQLDNFNNSTAAGKRWSKFNPTARDYRMPGAPQWQAVDFTNVTAVGIVFELKAYADFYRINKFYAKGTFVTAAPWIRFNKSRIDAIATTGQSPASTDIIVSNGAGTAGLGTIQAESNAAWLIPSVSGTTITNAFTTSGLSDGQYYAVVTVRSSVAATDASYGVWLNVQSTTHIAPADSRRATDTRSNALEQSSRSGMHRRYTIDGRLLITNSKTAPKQVTGGCYLIKGPSGVRAIFDSVD